MDMRTPLGKARSHGSARDGVHAWKLERISAVALAPLVLWFAYFAYRVSDTGYDGYVALISKPGNTALMIMFIATMFYHMMLGMTVVIEDYVHNDLYRYVLQLGIRFMAAAMGVFCTVSILKVAFGV